MHQLIFFFIFFLHNNTCINISNLSTFIFQISKLYYWEWPVEGKYSGYIRARSLPHIGEWSNFTPAYVANLWNTPLHRPQLNISEHTTPESTWTIPISNESSKYCHIIN
jgi:hypothetical protein